ncbi:MAG: zinc ribbon domain-containing protein [Gemmataceae bacterium]
MPTYDYVCDACEHKFEQWQSFHDEPLKKCPACKKAKLRRLFGGGAAILFKGSGFYETDYNRSESYKNAEKSEKESSTKSETKTETKSESKSEVKTESKSESKPSSAKGKKSS